MQASKNLKIKTITATFMMPVPILTNVLRRKNTLFDIKCHHQSNIAETGLTGHFNVNK